MSIQETTLVAKLLSRLSGPMASAVAETIKVARRRGLSLYLVGGGVRDLLLERSHLDVDLAVEGDAASLAEEVAVAVEARLTVHQRFGTASLRLPAGQAGARTSASTWLRPATSTTSGPAPCPPSVPPPSPRTSPAATSRSTPWL